MTIQENNTRKLSNAYYFFIFILTILSLLIMVLMMFPIPEQTLKLLFFYDNFICLIFLIDFVLTLRRVPSKSEYFIQGRGWLDLMGSIPSLGIFKFSSLLRLARLSRLVRIARRLGRENRRQLVKDIVTHRSEYAIFITMMAIILILSITSVLVLSFESQSPGANITTGWESLWYSIVTITTVGYGDFYPITFWGRVTGMFIMVTGVGIIGALASILSTLLLGSHTSVDAEQVPNLVPAPALEAELAAVKDELSQLRQMLEELGSKDTGNQPGVR